MSAVQTEIRKCVYCLVEQIHSRKKQHSAFTPEHVVHDGLTGGIRDNLTLVGLVCAKCNGELGRGIDQRLLRSGYIGMLRFHAGQKCPSRFHEYDLKSLELTAHSTEESAVHGLAVKRFVRDGQLVSEFGAVAVLKIDGEWQPITEEQIDRGELPTISALQEIDFKMTCDPDDEPRIFEKLTAYYKIVEGSTKPWTIGTTPVFGVGELGEIEIRCLTKIAFNYFVYVCTALLKRPDIPVQASFHEIRNFIRWGYLPKTDPVEIEKGDVRPEDGLTEPPDRLHHRIEIRQEPNGDHYRVVCTVNIFNCITWRVTLSEHVQLEPGLLNHAHHWDLRDGVCRSV